MFEQNSFFLKEVVEFWVDCEAYHKFNDQGGDCIDWYHIFNISVTEYLLHLFFEQVYITCTIIFKLFFELLILTRCYIPYYLQRGHIFKIWVKAIYLSLGILPLLHCFYQNSDLRDANNERVHHITNNEIPILSCILFMCFLKTHVICGMLILNLLVI